MQVQSLGCEDPWRRVQQATPVSLPGESHGQEPGRLQSIGSQRVGQDQSNLACTYGLTAGSHTLEHVT